MNKHPQYPEAAGDAQHLATACTHARQSLARANPRLVALALIDLPVLPDIQFSDGGDSEVLHAVAPLYFSLEIELTGLTQALSRAAGLYMSGGLRLPRGPVANTLMDHHRNYETRRPSDDRFATYFRLFGNAPEGAAPFAAHNTINTRFDEDMLQLAEAMHRYAIALSTELSPSVARRQIQRAARQLAETLLQQTGGATPYMADEALTLIQRATDVFGERSVQTAFGVNRFWDAVSRSLGKGFGSRRPGLSTQARQHLIRGRSGMVLIEWAASQMAGMTGLPQIDRSDPVLAEGTQWLEATLSLLSSAEAGHAA